MCREIRFNKLTVYFLFSPIKTVAFSSKPKDPSAVLNAEKTEDLKRKRLGRKKGKGKGKGKKRNPCLIKYKDFCIHGTCQYLRDLKGPSCM